MNINFLFHKVGLPYYHNELDDILNYYRENFNQGSFLVPVGAISSLDRLRALSDNRLFFISADKAFCSLQEMAGSDDKPHIVFHDGCFSLMANFDFIGRYIQKLGGDVVLNPGYSELPIFLCVLGQSFCNLPETTMVNYQFNQHFDVSDFLNVKNKIVADIDNLTFQEIIGILKFSYWDTEVFMLLATRFGDLVGHVSSAYYPEVQIGLEEVYKNYYHLQENNNVLFSIGYVYHSMRNFCKAILYYERSLVYINNFSNTYLNIGLCHYYSKSNTEAVRYLECALLIDPDNEYAKEWLGKILNF